MVEFNEDGAMKAKNYPRNYIVKDEKQWPIIIINYNKYIFFANDNIQEV